MMNAKMRQISSVDSAAAAIRGETSAASDAPVVLVGVVVGAGVVVGVALAAAAVSLEGEGAAASSSVSVSVDKPTRWSRMGLFSW